MPALPSYSSLFRENTINSGTISARFVIIGLQFAGLFCLFSLHSTSQVVKFPLEGDLLGHEDTSAMFEVFNSVFRRRLDNLLLLLFCKQMGVSCALSSLRGPLG